MPLLAKLSPSVAEVAAIALAAAEGGAHGLVLINTVRGMAIDRATLRPLLGGGGGGLSGPAVKPVALHAVFHAHAATGLPIIGMGGVAESAQDCRRIRWPPGRRSSASAPRSSATPALSAGARRTARALGRTTAFRGPWETWSARPTPATSAST